MRAEFARSLAEKFPCSLFEGERGWILLGDGCARIGGEEREGERRETRVRGCNAAWIVIAGLERRTRAAAKRTGVLPTTLIAFVGHRSRWEQSR